MSLVYLGIAKYHSFDPKILRPMDLLKEKK